MTIDEVLALRNDIIAAGKHSPNLAALGVRENKCADPKYFDKEDMENTGAITAKDAEWLYNYVLTNRFSTVLEFGTWFGTSAYVMAQAMIDAKVNNPLIMTVDKNNLLVVKDGYLMVKYYNMHSNEFLSKQLWKPNRPELVFADASLTNDNVDRLLRMQRGGVCALVHDFITTKKGVRNVGKYVDTAKQHKRVLEVAAIGGTDFGLIREHAKDIQ